MTAIAIVVPRSGSASTSTQVSGHHADRVDELLQRSPAAAAGRPAPGSGEQHHRQLGHLGRLDGQRADRDPARGAVDRERRPAAAAPPPGAAVASSITAGTSGRQRGTAPARRSPSGDPDHGVHGLLDQRRHRVRALDDGRRRTRRCRPSPARRRPGPASAAAAGGIRSPAPGRRAARRASARASTISKSTGRLPRERANSSPRWA